MNPGVERRPADLPPFHPGALLEQKRVDLGLTVTEAARLAGVETTMWSRIEMGRIRCPEWATICKLLAGLGVAVTTTHIRAPKLEQLT